MASLDPGSEFAGHRIEAIIGRGGMGIVYRATDVTLDRVVALKVIAPEYAQNDDFRARFKRESRLAASIRHPHVISIYRAGEEGEQLFITMDYVEGTDLKELIAVRGRLDPMLATTIVSQVAFGLDAAHGRGLVHRDVKPGNVLIEDRHGKPQAYLTDFGLTKHAASESALTRTGMIVGTTDYIAPEQIEGGPIDARTDVYALGCVLFETLTGAVPFPRDSDTARLWARLHDEPPSVRERAPGLPAELDSVVRRAMARAPNERFLSAGEMAQAVTGALASEPAPSTGTAAAPPADTAAPADVTRELVQPKPAGGHVKKRRRPPVPETVVPETVVPETVVPETVVPEAVVPAAPVETRIRPPQPRPEPAAPAAARRPLNPRVLAGAGVGLVVAIAVAIVILAGGGDDSDKQRARPASSTPTAIPLPADLRWRALRDAPFARQYAASTAVGGTIWVFGGLGDKTSSTTTMTYDPAINAWSSGPGLPLPLHHASAVTYKGEAVLIGGWVPAGSVLTGTASREVFALRGEGWVKLPSLNHPRAAAAAAVVDDKIVVVGGQADGKLVPQSEIFDGKQWKDAAPIPTPREHLAAASDGTYLYAVGGRALSVDANSDALERYDPAANSWKKLPTMPIRSGSVSAAVIGGRLIAVGGETATTAGKDVQAFDLAKQEWSALTPLPTPRHGVALAVLRDSLYAIGGAETAGHFRSTRRAAVLDFSGSAAAPPTTANLEWRTVQQAPYARQYAAATATSGTIWAFGGLGDNASSTTAMAYDPAINTWKTAPPLPLPLHHASAVTLNRRPVLIGGWVPSGSELAGKASAAVFALREQGWVKLPSLHHPRAAAAAAVVDGKIVVVGGQANGKLVTATEIFDGKRWTDGAPMPTAREHLAAAASHRYLYAVGGRALSAGKNSNALERYDPRSNRWTKLPSMPSAAGGIGAAIVAGRLVTIGGETTTSASDTVQAFDLTTQKWSALPPLPTPRHGVAVAVVRDSVYAIGGATAAGHVDPTRKVEVLDFR